MNTTETKHTAGEWTVQHAEDGTPWIQGEPDANGFRTVATLPNHFAANDKRKEANARLIASAPDLLKQRDQLLAALQRLLDMHNDQVFICGTDDRKMVDESLSQARAEIRQATEAAI